MYCAESSALQCFHYEHFLLQKTSNGERKIVDLIDTTGSGDVDTSTVRRTEVTTGREIVGLTGRLLHLPDTWSNPTGEWHLGIKAEFELLPTTVENRVQVHVCGCVCEYICISCVSVTN